VAGGLRRLGVDNDPDAWDNEQPGYEVDVAAFALQRTPVVAGQWLEFIQVGGYDDERLWSDAGNAWRSSQGIDAPLFWERRREAWWRRSLSGLKLVDPELPVVHVSFHEAQAFARAFGARLPTESEWETAASVDREGTKRRYPWGDSVPDSGAPRANAGLVEHDVARPGRFTGEAACGAVDLIGGVWEWVETPFSPYPDFRPQAYRGYSAPWFDGRHRVARGGSYLTQLPIARATFRNWYLPELRQPALGLRLAKDA
jgi:iron(II)-dependent oxidoreductase